jgi:hypothetical protein
MMKARVVTTSTDERNCQQLCRENPQQRRKRIHRDVAEHGQVDRSSCPPTTPQMTAKSAASHNKPVALNALAKNVGPASAPVPREERQHEKCPGRCEDIRVEPSPIASAISIGWRQLNGWGRKRQLFK